MKREDFQNTKIRVRNEAESKEFQEAMFKLGFRWMFQGDKIQHAVKPFLFIGIDIITYEDDEIYFNRHRHKEITIESIRNNMKAKLTKEVAEKMYKSEDESVRAFALSNYPELGEEVLPKTWEELGNLDGYYIHSNSDVYQVAYSSAASINKNVFPTRELAEAALALAQLLQLRDRYNGDWVADWSDGHWKYVIEIYRGKIDTDVYHGRQKVMHFKTAELRDKFLENFRDLLEIAKPLL